MGDDPRVIELKRRGKEGGAFMKQQSRMFVMGAVGVFLLLFLSKAVVIVAAGHVGVKDLFGKVSDNSLVSGFHVVNPLLKIYPMSVQTNVITETSAVPSKEGMSVGLDISLLYSLMPQRAPEVYKTLGLRYDEKVVVPQLRSVVRGVTAGYEAKALYTAQRKEIENQIYEQLAPVLEKRGIRAEQVLLRSVTLPTILSTAIDKKLEAEQQAEQMQFVLQREQQEAERKKIEGDGIAAFSQRASAGLTPAFLQWKGIEATKDLAKSENSKVIVIGSGKDGMPLILGGQN